MKLRFGKKDYIVLIIIAAAILVCWTGYRSMNRGDASLVCVTVDGSEYGIYDLDEDQTIAIVQNGRTTNTLVIRNGEADMTEADCPDKLCVHQRSISAVGETIVCLPNKVIAEVISSDQESEFDAVAK